MRIPWRRAAVGVALLAPVAAAVVIVLLVSAGRDDRRPLPQPEAAVSKVAAVGSFDGYVETPANVQATNDPAQCTELSAGAAAPVRHEVQMTGVFDDRPGDGRATFTSSSAGYQNLEGTYADPPCRTRTKLTGMVTVEFGPHRCTGTGGYERRSVTVYTMDFDGTCDDTTTEPVERSTVTIQFDGTQTPCHQGCGPDQPTGATSRIAGTYET